MIGNYSSNIEKLIDQSCCDVGLLRTKAILSSIYGNKDLSYSAFSNALHILDKAKEAASRGELEFTVSINDGAIIKEYIEKMGFTMKLGDYSSHWSIGF